MPEEVSPRWGRVLAVAIAVFCVGTTLAIGFFDSWTNAALGAPWLALFALAAWAIFWRPCVVVSDAGVRLVNVSRTIDVPWPALQGIETRWALTLVTAYGRFTAWGAPAPGAYSAFRAVGTRPHDTLAASDGYRPSGRAARRTLGRGGGAGPATLGEAPRRRPPRPTAARARSGNRHVAHRHRRRGRRVARAGPPHVRVSQVEATACSSRSRSLRFGIRFCRGSKASRRPSPMNCRHSTMAITKKPGQTNSHGRVE